MSSHPASAYPNLVHCQSNVQPVLLIMMLVIALTLLCTFANAVQLDPKLSAGIQNETTSVLVTFLAGPDTVFKVISEIEFESRTEKITKLRDSLIELATRSQASVKEILVKEGFAFQSIWISNQINIPAATPELIAKLLLRDAEISAIVVESVQSIHKFIDGGPFGVNSSRAAEIAKGAWGIGKIGAHKAQQLLHRISKHSHKIIVSSIDTGVRSTHEALRDNFIITNGWFDPYEASSLPVDTQGHGTHTMGTICGHGGIGVFPEAKWLSCRGCFDEIIGCTSTALLICAQFILCPTLPDGTNPICALAPNVVSNSWGGGQGDPFFDPAIAAFHIADIIPIFSIGNDGPSCETAHSPGDREGVIAVGCTTIHDEICWFSSVGPTVDGRIKPDISAPGLNIVSAWNTADDAYEVISGTSMACPHVSGSVGLLLSQNIKLTYAQVQELLFHGSETDLASYVLICGGLPDDVFPNNFYGHGRVDVYQSLKTLYHRLSI